MVSCQLVQCRATEARHDDPHGTQASGRSWNTVGRQSDGNLGAGGTRPRLGIRDIDYQLVRKSSVETQPKKCRRFHTIVKNTSDYQLVTILVRGRVPPVALYLLKRFARSLRDQFPHDEQVWDTHQRKEEEGAARVTGQRRVFFRVSGRVVTMVEASRFSWRVYVPSWLTNAERDSSKDARS